MGLRHQDIRAMQRQTLDVVVARIDNEGLDYVTPEAEVSALPLSHREIRGNCRGVTRGGARAAMLFMYQDAMSQADGIGTLSLKALGLEA